MDDSVFIENNEFALKKLVAFVTLSTGFTLSFIQSPRKIETGQVIEYLTHHPACKNFEFVIISCDDPELKFLLNEIQQSAQAQCSEERQEKIFIIRGLENAIKVLGDYPPILVDLNFTRDAYRRKLPYPIIFILPDYAITRMARFAPDFWAWKSAEFQLKAPVVQTTKESKPKQTLGRELLNPLLLGLLSYSAIRMAKSVLDSWTWKSAEFQRQDPVVQTPEKSDLKQNPIPDIAREKRILPVSKERFTRLNGLLDQEYTQPSQTRADLFLQRSLAHESHANYQKAEEDAFAALHLYHKLLSPDDPAIASALSQVAEQYYNQGKYSDAEPLFQRALEIRERQLGTEHPEVTESFNNLARLYQAQGKYAEAEPFYRRSLSIREKQLGAEHPEVAASLNNLARLYQAQGKYAEAEPLYRRSLSIKEKQLEADHPDVANSLNNLANLYFAQGKYVEAEPLYKRSFSIRERQLGADHPDVATSLNNLARLYQAQGKYAEAELLFRRVVEIAKKKLGFEHPDTKNYHRSLENVRQAMLDE